MLPLFLPGLLMHSNVLAMAFEGRSHGSPTHPPIIMFQMTCNVCKESCNEKKRYISPQSKQAGQEVTSWHQDQFPKFCFNHRVLGSKK